MVLVFAIGRGYDMPPPAISYEAFRQAAERVIAGAQAELPSEKKNDVRALRRQLKRQAVFRG